MSEINLKPCPFCGGKADYMTLFSGMKMFYCRNHKTCGAVISFDNAACNIPQNDKGRIEAWTRRAGNE